MPVKPGDTVKVEYRGTLEDGAIFDESNSGEPIKVVIGKEQLITGVENALIGMEAGESKTITIPQHEAYGQIQEGLTAKVNRSQLSQDIELKTGMIMEIRSTDEQTSMNVTIIEINEDQITIDANHPLAGKALNFNLKLVEIV